MASKKQCPVRSTVQPAHKFAPVKVFEVLEDRRLFTATLGAAPLAAPTPGAYGLSIPDDGPRLWFSTPERLATARAWYSTHPSTPGANDPQHQAFRYLMTGELSYGQLAVNRLVSFTISDSDLNSNVGDQYRWQDWVPVVYDWCHDLMTPEQRQTVMDRYNYYTDVYTHKHWGGPTMPYSNYFWGYLRNEMNWAIASWGENPMAPTYIEDALVTRWQNAVLPYQAGDGRGGVPQEGSQYGRYHLYYPLIPFATAATLGRDLYEETDFYDESVYYLIYNTLNGPTVAAPGVTPYVQEFPFGDDEFSRGFPSAH
jgi:hypothetical protein